MIFRLKQITLFEAENKYFFLKSWAFCYQENCPFIDFEGVAEPTSKTILKGTLQFIMSEESNDVKKVSADPNHGICINDFMYSWNIKFFVCRIIW